MDHKRFLLLLDAYQQNQLDQPGWEELRAAVQQDVHQEALQQHFEELWRNGLSYNAWTPFTEQSMWAQINSGIQSEPAVLSPVVRRLPRLRKWGWIAASVIVILAGGLYSLVKEKREHNNTNATQQQAFVDIAPGKNTAMLTINNSQTINLSSDKKSVNIDEVITYNDGEKIAEAGQALQLTTPRGGQYQAVLPDGSKVWLNAASSIKFPSKFNGEERKVEVTGEAYFEIAKDAARPFKVSGGGQEIDVLGTSFNINVYDDEPIKKTTLITGSIKITSNNQTAILKPGQQANISILEIPKIRLTPVQTNDIISWKDGLFNFNGIPLSEAMKQLERWYNIEVKYEAAVPDLEFKGFMQRNLNLSQVLKILTKMNVRYKLDGRTLIIHQ